ncbi:hypothetical protein ACFYZ9_29050 [Streptomyces sp. NPDC001691]|uniref:hypothetical protein n=1 Tax=Streptomyces sp. NPDC001691 TaxID=3364600 RepID=UPI003697E3EB
MSTAPDQQTPAAAPQKRRPVVRPTRFSVNLLPENAPDRNALTITVEYLGSERYRVIRDELCFLGADGKWSWGYQWSGGNREPVTDAERDAYHAGRDAWVASHQFDLETALHLAEQAAPHVRAMRTTAAQALADYLAEMEHTDCAD